MRDCYYLSLTGALVCAAVKRKRRAKTQAATIANDVGQEASALRRHGRHVDGHGRGRGPYRLRALATLGRRHAVHHDS